VEQYESIGISMEDCPNSTPVTSQLYESSFASELSICGCYFKLLLLMRWLPLSSTLMSSISQKRMYLSIGSYLAASLALCYQLSFEQNLYSEAMPHSSI
jgi:hypothetical protein